jgi:hypothetical protein
MIKIKHILVCLLLLGSFVIKAQNSAKVSSPDGKLVVSVTTENGKPYYEVSLNGKQFLTKSPLGLKTNVADLSEGLNMNPNFKSLKIDENYELANIKKSKIHYVASEATFTFKKDTNTVLDVIFRVSDNDIAFKYKVYPHKKALSCVVNEEATGFTLPSGSTTFLSSQSKPMVGFARTMPSYEIPYTVDDSTGQNGRDNNGYTFPCLFKVNSNGWVLISETGVDSRYCGSRLIGQKDGLYTIGYPMLGENNGNGTTSPGIMLPGETPWRTITVGETLAPIVETTVAFDVVKPLYEASEKYKYTKGSWSWIIKMDSKTIFEEQIKYIDFSAAMGYETVLVDALWDKQIGREKIVELCKYAKKKGVSLYLWYNSNGYWNDAPQGPRGIMDNTIARRKEMAWLKEIGVKGIKVDFFGGDKQMTLKLYEDILYDANEYGVLCIFHGATLPRGWERMYPNFASSEAVLASENLAFSQQFCNKESFNATLHPFIRNAVGSMDYGGSALNKFYNGNNTPNRGSKRMTSDVYALATAVLFQSPVQHFALAPNNLTDAPDWAINFMKEVPTTWDEVKFIDGYPGKYVILARRHGANWYVVAINAEKETLKKTVKLPMLNANTEYRLFADDEQLNGKLSKIKVPNSQEIEITVPFNGAVLIVK